MTPYKIILDKYHSGRYSNYQLWKYWKLISGDNSGIFLGEVTAKDEGIWTGDELAAEIGLTAGTSQYSDVPWLKFILDGELLFISMKTIRYNLSWDDINAVHAVYGNRCIENKGVRYTVALIKGASKDLFHDDPKSGYDTDWAYNSEWNRLIYTIHQDLIHYTTNDNVGINQSSYSDDDLLLDSTFGNGAFTWCRETPILKDSERVFRDGMAYVDTCTSSVTSDDIGWRPIIRRIN